MSQNNPTKATRLVASHFAKYSTDLIGYTARRYAISIDEMAIIALVFAESTRPIREDPYLASKFGFEDRPLPNEYRVSVNLKFIHTSLGMSRETTRRKLERLVTRGFLSRINGGYVLPMPHERVDLANGFRETLLKTVETIAALGQRPRAAD